MTILLDVNSAAPLDSGRLNHEGTAPALAAWKRDAKRGDQAFRAYRWPECPHVARHGGGPRDRRQHSGLFLFWARQRLNARRYAHMPKSTAPSPPDSSHTTQFVSDALALMGRGLVFAAAFGAQLHARDLEVLAVALLSLHDRLTASQKEERP